MLTDIEKQKQDLEFKGATNIKVVGEGWALSYKGEIKVVGEGWALSYKGEGNKRKTTKANSHYSTTYGVSGGRGGTTVDGVAPTKRAGLNVLKPYFQNLTDCFKKSFPAQYQAHDKAMSACHGNSFYQEHSVFSAMVVNRHEIDGNGLEKKRSRAAIHIDKGHHKDTFELMLTLKQNIAGGDLYLPEYGILLKLQDRSVTCFNATVQKHAVTAIGRENLSKQANRVTAVAYMTKLSDGMLLTAKDHANSRAASARASVPRAVPGQAGHLGYMPLI